MNRAENAPTSRLTPTWIVATVSAGFGLFYAYAVWNAIGNLVQANAVAAQLGGSLSALGWLLWVLAAVMPVVVWALGFAIGRRRRVREFLLVMLSGLAVVAAFWLNVVAFSLVNTASLLG